MRGWTRGLAGVSGREDVSALARGGRGRRGGGRERRRRGGGEDDGGAHAERCWGDDAFEGEGQAASEVGEMDGVFWVEGSTVSD